MRWEVRGAHEDVALTIALELPVYHVTEDAVKAEIAPGDYDEHLVLMAMAMDVDAIAAAVRAVREGQD